MKKFMEVTTMEHLKSEVDRIWKLNKIAIFDIDVVGGANIKNMFPDETLLNFCYASKY